jgi:NTP pyrophosphatase (non-canonical NTP hydrolase)
MIYKLDTSLAYRRITRELAQATAKHPEWPTDPMHALTILTEEVGELAKTILQARYEGKEPDIQEAIQTAAMAVRFLANWDQYKFTGDQP